jgi:hypothetical protein
MEGEIIFMQKPTDYKTKGTRKVCKLLKILYGLKQAPLLWQKTLEEFMKKHGYIQSPQDPCLFSKGELVVAIFVDDMLACCSTASELDELINLLFTNFKVKDLGSLSHFLGISITYDHANGTLILSQAYYFRILL